MTNKKLKKILIVDDDPVIVKLLESRLKENSYSIEATMDASEGLQIAMNGAVDLVILDVMMPIINGYNFCGLLKAQEEQKHIPIIFLTSRITEEDMEIGRQMGAEAYLTKPINMEELLSKIRELLDQSQATSCT